MARSLYVMPTTGTGNPITKDGIRPKYRDSLFPDLTWDMDRYGTEPWCLVGIQDVPPATDTALNANADVFNLPDDLDQTLGTTQARNRARNALEAVNMPGTWIQTSDTYRTVVRFIDALCQYMQCYSGQTGGGPTIFTGTVTLATTFGALTAAHQQAMQACIPFFGIDGSTLTSANTLRTILKALGDSYVLVALAGTNPNTRLDLLGPL